MYNFFMILVARSRCFAYKTHMSLKIRTDAHARKMKVISVGTNFMGNRFIGKIAVIMGYYLHQWKQLIR